MQVYDYYIVVIPVMNAIKEIYREHVVITLLVPHNFYRIITVIL